MCISLSGKCCYIISLLWLLIWHVQQFWILIIILGVEANLKLHPAVFRLTVNLWKGLSFNICLALGKLPFFIVIRLETRNNQRELETSQSSSLLMVQFILDGSGAPQSPCHTLVAGSVSIHRCSILSMLIFQAQIRVAHWLQQKTDGWTTELKHATYKHVSPTNATILKHIDRLDIQTHSISCLDPSPKGEVL